MSDNPSLPAQPQFDWPTQNFADHFDRLAEQFGRPFNPRPDRITLATSLRFMLLDDNLGSVAAKFDLRPHFAIRQQFRPIQLPLVLVEPIALPTLHPDKGDQTRTIAKQKPFRQLPILMIGTETYTVEDLIKAAAYDGAVHDKPDRHHERLRPLMANEIRDLVIFYLYDITRVLLTGLQNIRVMINGGRPSGNGEQPDPDKFPAFHQSIGFEFRDGRHIYNASTMRLDPGFGSVGIMKIPSGAPPGTLFEYTSEFADMARLRLVLTAQDQLAYHLTRRREEIPICEVSSAVPRDTFFFLGLTVGCDPTGIRLGMKVADADFVFGSRVPFPSDLRRNFVGRYTVGSDAAGRKPSHWFSAFESRTVPMPEAEAVDTVVKMQEPTVTLIEKTHQLDKS